MDKAVRGCRLRRYSMQITGYGGVGEIGGNAFLLEIGKRRVMLDFGRRFGSDTHVEKTGAKPGWGDYFDDFLKPRSFSYVPDLLKLDLVPPLSALYRQDLGGDAGPAPLDAVLVSHAHMDHVGLLGLLKPEIPVIGSAETRAILDSIQTTGVKSPENEFLATKAKGNLGETKTGKLSNRARFDDGPARAWSTGPTLDGVEVTSLPVDHSIPGAQGFLLEAAEGTLAYTGDFRLHGRHRERSERLVSRAAGVGVLVSEGTNIHGGHGHHEKSTDDEVSVEADIYDAITAYEAKHRGEFIGIAYPPRDLDRLQSVHQVAKRIGRKLVITVRQAHLLDTLRAAGRMDLPDPRSDPNVAVYFEAAGKGLLLQHPGSVPVASADLSVRVTQVESSEFADLLAADYAVWARPYLTCPTMVGPLDVRREPGAYLFTISFWSITELFDIFPDRAKARGLYIHSQTQPFNDDMMQDQRKLQRWLKAYNLEHAGTHVSGHLDAETLDWVLDEIRPRTLVPVHSLAPDVTADKYRARTGLNAVLPQWGRVLPL